MKNQENIGRMLGCLYRHGRIHLQREFASLGLSPGSHHFLLMLARTDGLQQKELTDRLHIDKAHTARAIRKLTAQGYVRRERDPDDQRAVRIYLTKRGRNLLPEIRKIMRDWTETLTSGLSTAEKGTALSILGKMADNAVCHVRGDKKR